MIKNSNALLTKALRETTKAPQSIQLVLKQIIHTALMQALASIPLSERLVLQGGSALRLMQDNPRYSEDLDFARVAINGCPAPLTDADFKSLGDAFCALMSREFGVSAEVRMPKQSAAQRSTNGRVEIHRLVVKVAAQYPMLSSVQRVHVEIADVAAHDFSVMAMTSSQSNRAILVATPAEILADKIVAIVGREYLKPRDIWDVAYLLERGIVPNISLVSAKLRDYTLVGAGAPSVAARLRRRALEMQTNEFARSFSAEMERFIFGEPAKAMAEEAHCRALIATVSRCVEDIASSSELA